MSRRRGEFEHRTSIFEGAFRAWSHLGGLEPEDIETRPPGDLDPLTNPIVNDARLSNGSGSNAKNPDGSTRREYPYEPLPRSGLTHPYVQAILSPWLGPDADNEAIQLGLTTLRTWWQHRRKGESGSAIAALGTEKMKGVVEGYTRHFFTLSHCLIASDKEQPPRTLHNKMKELEKIRARRNRRMTGGNSSRTSSTPSAAVVSSSTNNPGVMPNTMGNANSTNARQSGNFPNPMASNIHSDLQESNLSPLERLHAAQRRQMTETGSTEADTTPDGLAMINMKGKCMPGKIDLGGMMDHVNRNALQLTHQGKPSSGLSQPVGTTGFNNLNVNNNSAAMYGDPNTTPVVFASHNGDIQIAMSADGITCAHCVKIVETVLKGCNGNKSPIDGLLDAAADRDLCSVLIKIDKASNAKRIAFEAARNLSMVGYTAKAKEMSIVGEGADAKSTMSLGALSTAFEVVASTDSRDVFDWTVPCTCPDNGVLREDCLRHSQMNTRIFDAFDAREKQVTEYMAGCGMKYGMACTCGPNCRCKNCPIHHRSGGGSQTSDGSIESGSDDNMNHQPDSSQNQFHGQLQQHQHHMLQQQQHHQLLQQQHQYDHQAHQHQDQQLNMFGDEPLEVDQPMNFFGMEAPSGPVPNAPMMQRQATNPLPMSLSTMQQLQQQHSMFSLGNNNNNNSNINTNNNSISNHNNSNNNLANTMGNGIGTTVNNSTHQPSLPSHHQAAQQQQHHHSNEGGRAQRNPSVMSYGNGLRHMSLTSETTFGRAMSGLSALSIDWENLEDFDLDVDHSAHIVHNGPKVVGMIAPSSSGDHGIGGGNGGRRSSFRRSFLSNGSHGAMSTGEPDVSVTFKL